MPKFKVMRTIEAFYFTIIEAATAQEALEEMRGCDDMEYWEGCDGYGDPPDNYSVEEVKEK